jgi:DNA-binding CsgD family transcriptional regulator
MEQLTLEDNQKLLQGIQSLYKIQNLDTFGLETLAILDELIPKEASVFGISRIDQTTSDNIVQSLSQDFERLILGDLRSTIDRYTHENPLYQRLPLTLQGTHKISDFVSRQDFFKTESYQQVFKRMGVDEISAISLYSGDFGTVPRGDEYLAFYYFYHSWEDFSERDRLILNLLQPHLTQAYKTATRLQYLQQEVNQLQQSIDRSGVICLDGTGQVKIMTSQSVRWLQSYFPSHRNVRELPEPIQSWVRHQLSQLEGMYDLPFPCLPLNLQQDDRRLIIRLVIDRPGEQCLLLLAEERILSLLASLKLIGLSKREAEVLFWIIKGKDTKAIATEMRINYSTIRKHLENIYRKLKVKSQSEAIATALKKVGCLSSPGIV